VRGAGAKCGECTAPAQQMSGCGGGRGGSTRIIAFSRVERSQQRAVFRFCIIPIFSFSNQNGKTPLTVTRQACFECNSPACDCT
jgi:hypothetical protein